MHGKRTIKNITKVLAIALSAAVIIGLGALWSHYSKPQPQAQQVVANTEPVIITQPITQREQPKAQAEREFSLKEITHNEENPIYVTKNRKGENYIVFYPETQVEKIDHRIKKDLDYFEDRCKELKGDFSSVDYQALENGEGLISLVYTLSGYNEGGEVVDQDVFTRLFKQKSGKELFQHDVFKDSFFETASNKARLEITEQVKNKKEYDTQAEAFLQHTNAQSVNYDRFSFDKNGVFVYIDSNALFNVSKEVFSVHFKWEDIKEELKIDQNGKRKPKKEANALPLDVKDDGTIDPDKPMVALTFDDGPAVHTEDILKILKENEARATFFVCGNNSSAYPEILKQMVDMGCQIGNHTMYHSRLTEQSDDEMSADIEDLNDIVEQATGVRPKLIRPPYGEIDRRVRSNLSSYAFIMWNLDPQDWLYRDAKKVSKHILAEVKDGDIILAHDIHDSTAEAAKKFIPKLREKGFQLVTIDELFYYKGEAMLGGESYANME